MQKGISYLHLYLMVHWNHLHQGVTRSKITHQFEWLHPKISTRELDREKARSYIERAAQTIKAEIADMY